jgi:CBS domain containing-hemolysin-like protein
VSILVAFLIVFLLIVASAFFVAVEFALIAADRARLEALADQGRWPARAAVAALRRLSFHLSGAQLGITMVSLLLGFLAEPLVGRVIDPALELITGQEDSSLTIVVALLLATVFQMVAGELIPKNIAISHAEGTAQFLAPAARIVHGVFSPVILLFNGTANWMLRRIGIEPQEERHVHRSLEELEYLIRTSGNSGALDPESHSLLTRTLRFGGKTAADALTPRVHLAAVPVTASVADLADRAAGAKHSRYPVYDGDLDNVRGVALITSILGIPPAERAARPVTSIMVEPLVVPETRDLVDILEDFRTTGVELAVVIDEHGGTAGILTLEDVLEEIVGEVDDEHDEASTLTGGVADGVYAVAGTLHLDEVADLGGLQLPPGEYETVAGFMLDRLGRIPGPGDSLQWDGWTIEVVEMDGLRIASLQLTAPDEGT